MRDLILGLINSKILAPLNKIWFKFGLLLGRIVSPVIMGIIFFLVVNWEKISLKVVKKYDELCKKQEIPIDKLLKDWAEKLWQKK